MAEVYLSPLRPGVRFRCRVLSVESPSLLWLSPANAISASINDYLNCGLEEPGPVSSDKWLVGGACVAQRRGARRRAVIQRICRWEDGVVRARVVWVDEGGWDWVTLARLKAVPNLLRFHPWQAVPVRLAGLAPANRKAEAWSQEAVDNLKSALELHSDCPIYAEAIEPPSPPVEPGFAIATVLLSRKRGSEAEPRNLCIELSLAQRQLFTYNKRNPGEVKSRLPPNAAELATALPAEDPEPSVPSDPTQSSGSDDDGTGSSAFSDDDLDFSSPDVSPVYLVKKAKNIILGGASGGATAEKSLLDRSAEYATTLATKSWRRSTAHQGLVPPDLEKGRVPDSEFLRLWVVRAPNPATFYAYALSPALGGPEAMTELRQRMRRLAESLDEFYSADENRWSIDPGDLRSLPQSGIGQGSGVGGVTRSVGEESGGAMWPGAWARVEVLELEFSADARRIGRLAAAVDRSRVPNGLCDLHRALVRVRFIDTGGLIYRRLDDVYALDRRFCSEPAMVITCALTGIRPANNSAYNEACDIAFRRRIFTDLPSIIICADTQLATIPSEAAGTLVIGVDVLDGLAVQEASKDGELSPEQMSRIPTVTSYLIHENHVVAF